ncbi:MAG TPA: metal-dependent hydrolase [Holophagaceae bacterium]|nr:metal-dependent hydrolase [Holophagaceae bacterium]
MASCFGHAVAAAALGTLMLRREDGWRPWVAGALLANVADLDVLGFPLGIPYAHAWGHRGATHSAVMAVLLGGLALKLLRAPEGDRRRLGGYCVLAALSHPLLDMATSGGLGIALAWPFAEARWFWPARPIRVSPIGVGPFLSARGLRVLASEAVWIGVPSMAMAGPAWGFRWRRGGSHVA